VKTWNKDEGALDTQLVATHEEQSGQPAGTESIGCFGLTISQPSKTFSKLFKKHLSIKQSIVSTKQQVVFHLV